MNKSIFQNSNENIVRIFALKFFVASWGLPESFLGLPGDFVSNIINKEASRKPEEAKITFRAKILIISSLLFWKIDDVINSFRV